jgi:hypothetical protein
LGVLAKQADGPYAQANNDRKDHDDHDHLNQSEGPLTGVRHNMD